MNCIFCKIITKEIPANILHEDNELLAFHDIHPKAPKHILIIPKKHIETVNDVTEADEALMGKIILTAKKLAKKIGIDQSGYRTLFNCNSDAGQEVYHIHCHLLGGRKLNWPPG